MMLIETRVQPSAIHGAGLFTLTPVPRGMAIWRFHENFDREFTLEQFSALPAEAQKHLRWFAFFDTAKNCWVLSGDHACFMNHSAKPNTGAAIDAKHPVSTVALRDIATGEELTCDYFAFDAEVKSKLGK
ncbi:MAG TPA: SET domain-containing protein-lysine N-methyltransferase [Candidatus Sulfotelmatobacter sp.]|jgi:SET domain-containing protein|nr:SET domain-containing protein-lysine N-methyltransferase [Candidatus Sulfotelmatobacter sp.]